MMSQLLRPSPVSHFAMWSFAPSSCVTLSRAENLRAEYPSRRNVFRMAVDDPQSSRELRGISPWIHHAAFLLCLPPLYVWGPLPSPLPRNFTTLSPFSYASVCYPSTFLFCASFHPSYFFLPNVPLCFTTRSHSPIRSPFPSSHWALFIGSGDAQVEEATRALL